MNEKGLSVMESVIESDLRTPVAPRIEPRTAKVAFVPNALAGKYAGYLYVMGGGEGPVLSVPGIIGAGDDSEPDSECAEALIGRPIGPWLLGADGWYAEIR
jgi:hypothetical protein